MELSDDALRSIIGHFAHLRAEYGDVLAEPDLVEPNGDYFPDDFTLDPEGIQALVERMATYAPLSSDLDIRVAFVEPDGESAGGGGCGSGACGPGAKPKEVARMAGAVETEDGYAVVLTVADVGDPTVLTAAIARAIGRIVLFEAGEEVDPREEGVLAELTATACGLGVLLLNGACVYKKGCGGMRQHRATFLGVEELSLANALFVRTTEKKAGAVKKHLEVTQREAFTAALDWVDAQPKLVRGLVDAPETLTDGVFAPEEKQGILSRLFSRKAEGDLEIAPAARPRATERTEEERRRLEETKALVEEALQDN